MFSKICTVLPVGDVMDSVLDVRYEQIRTISQYGERLTCEAKDKLTGRRVIMKTDALPLLRRELSILLALPKDVGPAVVDAVWTERKSLVLILEYLPGRPLLETSELTAEELPAVIRSVAQNLAHLHRMGVVHADLKPANVYLLESSAETANHTVQTRLLDFGFSLSRFVDPTAADQDKGGTPQFMAPELARGWVVDGRADQYSLGKTIQALYPALLTDSQWAPVIQRMCETRPARRYPNMIALRDELPQACKTGDNQLPMLGAGPLRGRDETIEELLDCLKHNPASKIRVQGRAGIGVSRFLLEAVLAIAGKNGAPTRCIDLDDFSEAFSADKLTAFIDARQKAGETVLCGISDPSPELYWLQDQLGESLRSYFLDPSWRHQLLRPVASDIFEEVVLDNIGVGGELAIEFARRLYKRCDGCLTAAADGFATILSAIGTEDGLTWQLNEAGLTDALDKWLPDTREPALTSLPETAQTMLISCAAMGFSFSKTLASRFLAEFHDTSALGHLTDRGLLTQVSENRLEFGTGHLWREATALLAGQVARYDAWLNQQYEPDTAYPDEVILACRRAVRLGDKAREAELLSQALTDAVESHRYDQIRIYYFYPDPPPATWSVEAVTAQARRLKESLGPDWSEERILLVAGDAIMAVDNQSGATLMNAVAKMGTSLESLMALIQLVDIEVSRSDEKDYNQYLERLAACADLGKPVPDGVIEHFRARRAMSTGNSAEAKELAAMAAPKLHGSGLTQECANLQMMAIMDFGPNPEAAITNMQAALVVAGDPNTKAQVIYNLVLMFGFCGNITEAMRVADEGIRELGGLITEERLLDLRVQNTWSLAELDLIDQAMKESLNLLNLAVIRRTPPRHATVRSILGYCNLHRSSSRTAIVELARAWETANQGKFPGLRESILPYLVDALLDLEAWDSVTEYGETLFLEDDGSDETKTILARCRALCLMAEGNHQAAAAELTTCLEAARRLNQHIHAARYIHQLGMTQLALGSSQRDHNAVVTAKALFSEAVELLDREGNKYYLGRAKLALALAQAELGETAEAAAVLNDAVELSRRIQSLGLLVKCLQTRARLNFGE
jgi:serine/threonine protein kinase/tetratricopeptide (TPR) repeat protein